VRNILRAHGLETAPTRHEPTWNEFLSAQQHLVFSQPTGSPQSGVAASAGNATTWHRPARLGTGAPKAGEGIRTLDVQLGRLTLYH
jgi:hypothetical protein